MIECIKLTLDIINDIMLNIIPLNDIIPIMPIIAGTICDRFYLYVCILIKHRKKPRQDIFENIEKQSVVKHSIEIAATLI